MTSMCTESNLAKTPELGTPEQWHQKCSSAVDYLLTWPDHGSTMVLRNPHRQAVNSFAGRFTNTSLNR